MSETSAPTALPKSLHKAKKKIHLSADPAFSLSPAPQKSNDGIAFSFREKELSIPLIRRALSSVDRNASVIYMPMDDQAPLPCYNANDIISLIGKCGGAVGSRLHFLIFAILSGIPFVAVGSDPKLCALSRMTLGLPSIDPSLFSSPDALASEIRKYLSLAPTFPRKEFIGLQKHLYLRDMDRIAALIKNI